MKEVAVGNNATLHDFLKIYTANTLLSYSQCYKSQRISCEVKDELPIYGDYLWKLLEIAKERKDTIFQLFVYECSWSASKFYT